MPHSKPRVLVLGSGFLGTAIGAVLRDQNYPVRIFSRNVNHNPAAETFPGKIEELNTASALFDSVDTILHTIHTTVPVTSMQHMEYDIQSNVLSLIRVLDAMVERKIKRLIFLSSGGAVYGQEGSIPKKETDATNPISSYGIAKLMMEKYILMYQQHHGIEATILRPSNIYGIGQPLNKPQGVIGYLVDGIRKDIEVTIWGDGSASKDFLFLDDFLRGILSVVNQDSPKKESVYNISSGNSISLKDLIAMLEKISGKRLRIRMEGSKKHDVQSLALDNTLFRKEYGWTPSVSLEDGLARILTQKTAVL